MKSMMTTYWVGLFVSGDAKVTTANKEGSLMHLVICFFMAGYHNWQQ